MKYLHKEVWQHWDPFDLLPEVGSYNGDLVAHEIWDSIDEKVGLMWSGIEESIEANLQKSP